MDFVLRVSCDNAAFDGDPGQEVARILKEVSDKVKAGGQKEGGILDVNGNTVGRWSFERTSKTDAEFCE